MTVGKNRGRAIAAALAVAFCGAGVAPAHAQAQQQGFAAIIDAARAHPGCLGVDTGRTASGKQVIFAWFENKAALVAWYKSDAHQRAMKVAFPDRTFEREPLPDTPDNSGQILAIVSLKLRDVPRSEGAPLPIDTIGIELYTPLPGGVAVGGRFAPQAIRVPALREIDLATAAGRTR
jgi:quinol monooxygenase YgiN